MHIIETDRWVMMLPPEWLAEEDEDTIVIADRDEVGCIEISTICKEQGDFGSEEVSALARSESPDVCAWQSATLGGFTGCYASFTEEQAAIREWYVASGSVLLFITYSCDQDNGGMDDAAVDEILATLLPAAD